MANASKAEIREALQTLMESEEWLRLLYCVEKKYFWKLQKYSGAPQPQDFLLDTIEDLMRGNLTWPKDKVDIFGSLLNNVKSKVSNFLRKKSTGKEAIYDDVEQIMRIGGQEGTQNPEQDAENDMIMKISETERISDMEMSFSELLEYVLKGVKNDELLEKIVRYWTEHLAEDVSIATLAAELDADADDQAFQEKCDQAETYLRQCIKELKLAELRKKILDCVEDDEKLHQMLIVRLDNPDLKPKGIAEFMGVEVKHIHNAAKRLKRNTCLETLLKQYILRRD